MINISIIIDCFLGVEDRAGDYGAWSFRIYITIPNCVCRKSWQWKIYLTGYTYVYFKVFVFNRECQCTAIPVRGLGLWHMYLSSVTWSSWQSPETYNVYWNTHSAFFSLRCFSHCNFSYSPFDSILSQKFKL